MYTLKELTLLADKYARHDMEPLRSQTRRPLVDALAAIVTERDAMKDALHQISSSSNEECAAIAREVLTKVVYD